MFLICAKLKVTFVTVYYYLQLKGSVYRYIVDICTIPTICLSFTTNSTGWFFINSGSLVALMAPHQHSPCPEQMRYRHNQMGILNRAQQWTLWQFTTHLLIQHNIYQRNTGISLMGKNNNIRARKHTLCAENEIKLSIMHTVWVLAEFPLRTIK